MEAQISYDSRSTIVNEDLACAASSLSSFIWK
jgi:hypothetical protein